MTADSQRIPVALNLAFSAALLLLVPALLWLICNGGPSLVRVAALLPFCFCCQVLFSVIHEAEHDHLLPDKRANDLLGTLLGVFFPASFSLLRAAHLTHHGRNRTEAELIDFYRPHESRLLKTLEYYALMGGMIWVGSVLLSVLLCFVPNRLFRPPADHVRATDLTSYLAFLEGTRPLRLRLETLFVLACWTLLVPLLDLDLAAVGAYLLFGVVWSSQQFIYHVRTPLHVVEGSWNLRLWQPLSFALLHMNYHLTHHRHPKLPWTALPGLAEEPPWRGYLHTWARLLLPPRPYSAAWPQQVMVRGPLPEDPPPEFRSPSNLASA